MLSIYDFEKGAARCFIGIPSPRETLITETDDYVRLAMWVSVAGDSCYRLLSPESNPFSASGLQPVCRGCACARRFGPAELPCTIVEYVRTRSLLSRVVVRDRTLRWVLYHTWYVAAVLSLGGLTFIPADHLWP